MNCRATTYLQLQRLIGSRVDRSWRDIKTQAALSHDAYVAEAGDALFRMLDQARQIIPFYKTRSYHLDAAILASFPILTKQELIESYLDLMSPSLRVEHAGKKAKGYNWVEVRSGGTTGVPVAVIHGPDFRDHDRALRMFQMDLCGFPFGTPYFRLWGSMKDINQMKDSRAHRVMSWLARETVLNAFQMEAADMDRHLDQIEKSGIQYLMAYVDAAEHLARHALKRGNAPRLTSVMACAGTVTEEARRVIHEGFGARVHNKYGSRDAGEMACECEKGGLHIHPGVVVEAVDEQGRPCPPGVSGRLLITCLHNRDFPLIRYEIGDVGALADKTCLCGLPFPLLERLEGRTTEFLQSTTGGFVSPVYVRHLIGVVHPPPSLKRYQIEQLETTRFVLRLERESNASFFDDAPLRRDLLKVLGAAADLNIVDVDHIPEAASGKFQYVITRKGGATSPKPRSP